MGTSSFLYRIWKTRLCTVPSWTQAECRLLPSAKQEPAGARELRLPQPAAPSGVCRGLKAAAPSRTLVPRDQNRRTRCPAWRFLPTGLGWRLRMNLVRPLTSRATLAESLVVLRAVRLGWKSAPAKCLPCSVKPPITPLPRKGQNGGGEQGAEDRRRPCLGEGLPAPAEPPSPGAASAAHGACPVLSAGQTC